MPLPPNGDPRRPLHLAIRWMRVFGWGCLAITLLGLWYDRMMPRAMAFLDILPTFAAAAIYCTATMLLRRRQRWGIIMALFVSGLQTLLLSVLLFAELWYLFARGKPYAAAILILVWIASVRLIWHLSKSFKAMEYEELELRHGFEPLRAIPLTPPGDATDALASRRAEILTEPTQGDPNGPTP